MASNRSSMISARDRRGFRFAAGRGRVTCLPPRARRGCASSRPLRSAPLLPRTVPVRRFAARVRADGRQRLAPLKPLVGAALADVHGYTFLDHGHAGMTLSMAFPDVD